MTPSKAIGTLKAVLVGWLSVNVRAILIMLVGIWLGLGVFQSIWWVAILSGFVLGWLWWSYTMPRWRRWAHQHGISPAQLQTYAVRAGLAWPAGTLLAKPSFVLRTNKSRKATKKALDIRTIIVEMRRYSQPVAAWADDDVLAFELGGDSVRVDSATVFYADDLRTLARHS